MPGFVCTGRRPTYLPSLSTRPHPPAHLVSKAPHQCEVTTLLVIGTVLLSASCPKRLQEAQGQPLCVGNDSPSGQRLQRAAWGGEQLQRAFWPASAEFSGSYAMKGSPKTSAGTHRAWGSVSFALSGHCLPLQEVPSKWPSHLPRTCIPGQPASKDSSPPPCPTKILATEPSATLWH